MKNSTLSNLSHLRAKLERQQRSWLRYRWFFLVMGLFIILFGYFTESNALPTLTATLKAELKSPTSLTDLSLAVLTSVLTCFRSAHDLFLGFILKVMGVFLFSTTVARWGGSPAEVLLLAMTAQHQDLDTPRRHQ